MHRIAAPLLVSLFAAGTAVAQVPQNARPLSQILALLEQSGQIAWFIDVEWDEEGYWIVEYLAPNGEVEEVDIHPVTGAEVP